MTHHYRGMKRSHKVLVGLLFLLALAMIVTPPYALRAIWNGLPDLDDHKIFHRREIQAGTGQPWEISDDYNKTRLPDEIAEDIASYDPVAFLVVQDDKILYEEYWDGYSAASVSNSFSMAKGIIGLLVGAAIDDGYIKNLDQKVADFIPAFKAGGKSRISIRHLLTMSSGIDWDEAYSSLFSPTTELYYGTDLLKLINESRSVNEPGITYAYSSLDAQILALLIYNATGKTVSRYASEKFWKPMGAEYDAFWSLDHENGLEKAFCCFNSNARDFARWGRLTLNEGTWKSEQLVSQNYIQQMISPADHLVDEGGSRVNYYGFQWWIINYKGYQVPYMRGILGQYVFVIREKNAVVVRLGHQRSDELIGPNRKDIYIYLDAAFHILGL